MVDAMCRELELRDGEAAAGGAWATVYFGGGTPSLLSPKQVGQLFAAAEALRPVAEGAEVTLEANPDDLSAEALAAFAKTRVNRLSIGVQSFRGSDLRFMNRAHTAGQAEACIRAAQAAGFANLTIDLIYGSPGLSDADWQRNLEKAIELGVPHVSAYALTVEPRTALAHQIARGQRAPLDEAQAARQMELAVALLTGAGYEHYEVSSFALPGRRARHNSNYWLGEPYVGVGPSAHSYDGARTRSWNVAHNARYTAAIGTGELPSTGETLSDRDRYHELVLTRLRTVWGVPLEDVRALGFEAHFLREVGPLIARGQVEERGGVYGLTPAGRMVADGVSLALFAGEEEEVRA